jgi:hypothetical protein
MTNPSVTLDETGIAAAINDGDRFDSARNRMLKLDFTTLQEMKAIAGEADHAVGRVNATTTDGILLIASASGSQLAQYAWGAAHVILVAGAQKIVPTLADARQRIYKHSLKLEDGRALEAYGQNSYVGKILDAGCGISPHLVPLPRYVGRVDCGSHRARASRDRTWKAARPRTTDQWRRRMKALPARCSFST